MTIPVVVAGAGLAGLSTARHLKGPVVVVEAESTPGGTARSVRVDGFTFDYTGHLLHLHRPHTRRLILRLLKNNVQEIERNTWIHSQGVYTRYPFQAHLYGLPPSVVEECLAGVRWARRRFGDDPLRGGGVPSFREWCLRLFGPGISRHFMFPYNKKLWGVPAQRMTAEWCGVFVPRVTVPDVEAGAYEDHPSALGYNATFFYPQRGGIQVLPNALAKPLKDLRLGVSVDAVQWKNRRVTLSTGEDLPYRHLVSTLPLPELLKRLDPFPPGLREPLSRLKWRSVLCVNLGVRRPRLSEKSWVYFPENKFPFYRVGFPANFSKNVVPRGCSSMYVEVSRPAGAVELSLGGRVSLVRNIKEGLVNAGILKKTDALPVVNILPIPHAYVIYDQDRAWALGRIFAWLKAQNISSIGRYGAWKYSFMEEAIHDGMSQAKLLS